MRLLNYIARQNNASLKRRNNHQNIFTTGKTKYTVPAKFFSTHKEKAMKQPVSDNSDLEKIKDLTLAEWQTRKVFWEDPYRCTLDTTVHSVVGNLVQFKETIGYAESGGQESDAIRVNDIDVISAKLDKQTNNIFYELKNDHGLKAGDTVKMEINWDRRSLLMRYHFACELVLAIVNRMWGIKGGKIKEDQELKPEDIDNLGIRKTGAHMSDKGARVDFAWGENFNQFITQIMVEFHRIINADYPIEKGYINKAEQVRFWRIPDIATIPCGGTHVHSTKEIGEVTLKRERSGKGVERVKITLKDTTPLPNPNSANSFSMK